MKKGLMIIAMSALATAALIKAVPASSKPMRPENMSVVHTGDLDLATPQGRAVLHHRLVIAAYEVCGSAADVDLAGRNAVRACRAEVLEKVQTQTAQLARFSHPSLIVAAR